MGVSGRKRPPLSKAAQPATVKGTYLNAYKNIWDLYVSDSAADADIYVVCEAVAKCSGIEPTMIFPVLSRIR